MWFADRDRIDTENRPQAAQRSGAHVDRPVIVEREAGRMLWRLKAARAEQQLSGAMHLIQPELELFTDKGERVPVTGREAWFNPLRKRIRFRGHVRVRYRDWLLTSEDVRYRHSKDELVIPGDFHVQGKHTRGRGSGLTLWRKARHVHIAHGVWIQDDRKPKQALDPMGALP